MSLELPAEEPAEGGAPCVLVIGGERIAAKVVLDKEARQIKITPEKGEAMVLTPSQEGLATADGTVFVPSQAMMKEAREKALMMQAMNNARQLHTACTMYRADNGKYPATLKELQTAGLLDNPEVFVDPFTPDDAEGFLYFGKDLKESSEPTTVFLVGKGTNAKGERVVTRMDGSTSFEKWEAPAAAPAAE